MNEIRLPVYHTNGLVLPSISDGNMEARIADSRVHDDRLIGGALVLRTAVLTKSNEYKQLVQAGLVVEDQRRGHLPLYAVLPKVEPVDETSAPSPRLTSSYSTSFWPNIGVSLKCIEFSGLGFITSTLLEGRSIRERNWAEPIHTNRLFQQINGRVFPQFNFAKGQVSITV